MSANRWGCGKGEQKAVALGSAANFTALFGFLLAQGASIRKVWRFASLRCTIKRMLLALDVSFLQMLGSFHTRVYSGTRELASLVFNLLK